MNPGRKAFNHQGIIYVEHFDVQILVFAYLPLLVKAALHLMIQRVRNFATWVAK